MSNLEPFFKHNKKTLNQSEKNASSSSIKSNTQFNEEFLQNESFSLSNEDCLALQDACVDDSIKIMNLFSPKLEEQQTILERQVEAIEKIANEANTISNSSMQLAEESQKISNNSLQIAENAEVQADSAKLQAKLAEEAAQRAIAEAKDAKRDALFAKIVSIIAIIAPILYNFLTEKLPILLQVLSELYLK